MRSATPRCSRNRVASAHFRQSEPSARIFFTIVTCNIDSPHVASSRTRRWSRRALTVFRVDDEAFRRAEIELVHIGGRSGYELGERGHHALRIDAPEKPARTLPF